MGQQAATEWRAVLATASAGYATAEPAGPPGPGDPPEVGPYRVDGVLGQGGMGRVFLARDRRDTAANAVALKVLSRTGDATARARFRRELGAARRVLGEGTARVLDGDPYADPPWLATEYIPGPTLDQLVAARGPLNEQTGAALAVGVARALSTIHAAGVVHRDLKPANIILGPGGPRVVDFGIARTEDATTLSVAGWAMGTPGYMAPEQIADPHAVGAPVDVFALGAVLVFATTGLSPYAGGDPASVVYRIVHGTPRMDEVPGRLRALAAACLERDPAARPALAQIAAAGLRIVEETAREPASDGTATIPVSTAVPAGVSANPDIAADARAAADTRPPPEAAGVALGSARMRRGSRASAALLAVLLLAAVGVGGWFAVAFDGSAAAKGTSPPLRAGAGQGSSQSLNPSPSPSLSLGVRATPSVSPSVKNATKSGAAQAFSGGTVVTGPGCPASPWAVFSVTSGGSLETGVGGGYPACGVAADAFRKSGVADVTDVTDQPGSMHAEWDFDFKRAVVCTLEVYIANTDPSSGSALYSVASGTSAHGFTISQAGNKGRFAGAAVLTDVTAADGVIRLTLTDASPSAGDQNHVTASAVSAACRLG